MTAALLFLPWLASVYVKIDKEKNDDAMSVAEEKRRCAFSPANETRGPWWLF